VLLLLRERLTRRIISVSQQVSRVAKGGLHARPQENTRRIVHDRIAEIAVPDRLRGLSRAHAV
jgi:hypothetical protein